MRPQWTKAADKLPTNGTFCLISNTNNPDDVCGPIGFKSIDSGGIWIDLFATKEAGEYITADQVGYWIDWQDICPEPK